MMLNKASAHIYSLIIFTEGKTHREPFGTKYSRGDKVKFVEDSL